MIGVGIPPGPILVLPILPGLVLVPEFLDAVPNLLRRPDLLEPELGVVLHARRLPDRHLDPVGLGLPAHRERSLRTAVVLLARPYHPFVIAPHVPEVLHRLPDVLGGGGVVRGVDVVREPGVIVRYLDVVDREGHVDAVGRLAEGVDALSRLGKRVHLVVIVVGGGGGGVLFRGDCGDIVQLRPPPKRGGGGRGRRREEEGDAEGSGRPACRGGGGSSSSHHLWC